MEGNRKLNELDQKAHASACVSANTDLSGGRLGALSCDRATRVAKLGLSCWQRRRAAAPARTAAAAVHAGSQGVPWEPGIGWLPLRPQGPRASETRLKTKDITHFSPKNAHGTIQQSHLGLKFIERRKRTCGNGF